MELVDTFYKEVQKFHSILSANDLYSILNIKDPVSFDEPSSSNCFGEAFWKTDDLTLGIRVKQLNDNSTITTVLIWEKELGKFDIEVRAQLCFLFAKFYDKLCLNVA